MGVMTRLAAATLALFAGACSSQVGEDFPVSGAALAAPTDLQGVPTGPTQVLLTWTDNATGETGYRVDIAPLPITTPADRTAAQVEPADATSALVTASPGSTTWFRVVALTPTVQSGYSNQVPVTMPPGAPWIVDAWAVSPTRIDVSWLDVTTETGYRLERSQDGGATWTTAAFPAANATAHADTTVAPDNEYLYRLIALNAGGESAPSNLARAPSMTSSTDVTTAATGTNVGSFTSIAVTAAGVEHIAHYDSGAGNVLHTSGSGALFTTQIADAGVAGANVGYEGTSIALDGSGAVHVVAYDWTNDDLRHATNAGGPFAAVTVDSAGIVGYAPRLRIHPLDGSLQAVYRADGALRRAVFSGGAWTFETFTAVETIQGPAFDRDAAGDAHVAYSRWAAPAYELVYVKGSGGAWTAETVPTGGRPLHVAVVAGAGTVHVAFYDSDAKTLRYASKSGGVWSVEDADAPPQAHDVGQYVSIALDAAGRVHAAYYDNLALDLRYARREISGAWVRRVVDATGNVGRHTGIAIDGAGVPHVSYRDQTNLALKRATVP